MKKILSLALACLLALALPACAGSAGTEVQALTAQPLSLTDQEMTEQGEAVPAVYAALTDLGLRLLQGTAPRGEEGDALISPLSVALALSMAANGAEGETLAQFEEVLGGGESLAAVNAAGQALTRLYEGLAGSTECSIANSLWADPDGQIKEDFIGRCQGIFDAQVFQAELSDPAIVPALNGWVSDHTNEMIPELISQPFSEETAALLVNALYLKNAWEIEFDPLQTGERTFTHLGGAEEALDFLAHYSVDLPYLETEDSVGALLPYDDGRLAFLALMPAQAEADFNAWLDGLEGAELSRLIREAGGGDDTNFLRLTLPKFEAEWQGELKELLAGLGLDLAFDPLQADFSALGDNPDGYFLSQVIHATKIEVNEKGTEAAAATVVTADGAGDAPPPAGVELDFNRPFLYGIVDLENGVPLFLGAFA